MTATPKSAFKQKPPGFAGPAEKEVVGQIFLGLGRRVALALAIVPHPSRRRTNT